MKGFPRMKWKHKQSMRDATERIDQANKVLSQDGQEFAQARINASADLADAMHSRIESAPYRVFWTERECLVKEDRELIELAYLTLLNRTASFRAKGKFTYTITEPYMMQTGSHVIRAIVSVDGILYSWLTHDGKKWETDKQLKGDYK